MPVLSKPTGDEQLMLSSAVCLVQVGIGTSGACCRCSFPCYQLILCTRLCVHDSRHAAHNGSRRPRMSISSHMVHGNTVTCFEEPSETDGGSFGRGTTASRRTAEVAQQVVRTCPAGVDVEEIGRLEMFRGDSDLNSRVNSMPWSQWSLTVRSYTTLESSTRRRPGCCSGRKQTWKIRSSPTTRR